MVSLDVKLISEESRWISAAEECLQLFATPPARVLVADEDNHCFRVSYPIARHALNQVEACLTLITTGLVYPAVANVRVAFEHALVAQWVLLTDQGERAFVAATRRSNAAFVKDFAQYAEIPDDLLADADDPSRDGGNFPSMQSLCDRFDGKTKKIYTVYRSLSGAVHPSASTLARHLEWDASTDNFRLKPRGSTELPTDLAMALGWSAVMAAYVIETLKHEKSRVQEVERIARRGGLPTDLKSDDTQPHFQRRSPGL
ncbi:DUF5677 domain-containing protein [Rhodococcus sp. USK13]|uniref:DUF5677 domain-containing protein n=1 Tax=Rhodococcus sp. USK13 TaxID=2806442 RepID=UPI001BCADC58|nr:DUF5677 domain-containing protein [Rhodococcus sp. USK13]